MRKPPAIQLEHVPGDQFPDRETAQRAALPSLSENLQSVIQGLLERGELVNVGGRILPNRRKAPRASKPLRP